jgi:hypothetical protein
MGVINNFYFSGGGDTEDSSSNEVESSDNTPSFGYFLFNWVKVGIFLIGVYYILTFFPQFNQYKSNIKQSTKISSKLIVVDDLAEQNKRLNKERELFFNEPTKRRAGR